MGRLCSSCICDDDECYFTYDNEELSCTICRPHSSPILIAAVVVLQVSMVAFLVFRRSAATLFLAETVLAVVLLLLGIGEWYIFNIISIMALMFLLTSAERRVSHGNPHDSHAEVTQRTGIIKIILFFVQATPVIVNRHAWPSWVRLVVERLSALNMKISGLECLNPGVFSSPVGRFSFVMGLPILLSLSITFSVIVAAFFRWANLKAKLKRVCTCCQRARRRESTDALPTDAEDDPIDSLGRRPSSPRQLSLDSESEAENDSPHVSLLSRSNANTREEINRDGDEFHHNQEHLGDAEDPSLEPPSFRREVIERAQYAVLFVLFSGYFELSNSILNFLRPCDEDGYMPALPFVPCSYDDSIYKPLQILSWLFLGVYFFGIPALFGWILFRNRKLISQGSHAADRRVGFLYESFRREVFWFEMVWMARRVAISVIISFIARSSTRTAALTALLFLSLLLERVFLPFTTPGINNLETAGTGILLYSYVVGDAIAGGLDESEGLVPTIAIVLQTALWALNAGFIVFMVAMLVKDPLRRWWAWLKTTRMCACLNRDRG